MSSSESETEEPKQLQSIEKQRPPAQQAKAKRAMSEKQLAVLASARAKRLENCAAQRRAREQVSEPVIDAVPSAGAAPKPKRVSRKPTRRTVVHVPPPADDSESSSEEEIVYVQAPRRRKKAAKKKKKRVVVQAPPSSSSEESSSSDDEPAQPSAATNLYRTMRWV